MLGNVRALDYAAIPSNLSIAHQLNWYRFIGRVLGKALYEDILVDVSFARFFLAKVCVILAW